MTCESIKDEIEQQKLDTSTIIYLWETYKN
jgi:hypothetical protein